MNRIEIMTYRDPDAANEHHVFIDGQDASAVLDRVDIVDIDPGRGHVLSDWRTDRDRAAAGASPAAAALIRELYDAGESSEHVTDDTDPDLYHGPRDDAGVS